MVDPYPNKRKHSSHSDLGGSTSKTSQTSGGPSNNTQHPISKYSKELDKFIDMDHVDLTPIKLWVMNYLDAYHKEDAQLLHDIVFDRLKNEKVS